MAEIPRSLLNELTDEINALSGMAQRQAGDALTRLVADWEASGNGDIAALREAAYEVIETACGYYADTVAAGRAAEFYDAVRKALILLLSTVNIKAKGFADPVAFLSQLAALEPGCLGGSG